MRIIFSENHVKYIASIAAFLLVFGTVPGSAQFARIYGVHAGPVIAEQEYDYSPYSRFRGFPDRALWGFNTGAFVELTTVPYLSMVAELNYTQKGRTVTVNETAIANTSQGYVDLGPRDEAVRLHYLGGNVLAKIFVETPLLTPFLAIGPQFDFLIAHPESHIYEHFRKIELSLTVSAGVEIPLGESPSFLLEARYSPSTTIAYHDDLVTISNRYIAFLLGVRL